MFRSRGRSPGRAKAAAKTKAEEPAAKKAEDATDAPAKKAEKPAPKAVEKPKLKVEIITVLHVTVPFCGRGQCIKIQPCDVIKNEGDERSGKEKRYG